MHQSPSFPLPLHVTNLFELPVIAKLKRSEIAQEKRAKINLRRATKKKNAKSPKDQTAQAAAVQTSRDPAPKPAGASRKPSEASPRPAAAAAAPQPIPEEPHVPMNKFNAAEVEAMLSVGVAYEGQVYRPDKPTQKAGGVWGAKPGTMANGKDFWIELRQQVAEVQANGSVSRGENKKHGG